MMAEKRKSFFILPGQDIPEVGLCVEPEGEPEYVKITYFNNYNMAVGYKIARIGLPTPYMPLPTNVSIILVEKIPVNKDVKP